MPVDVYGEFDELPAYGKFITVQAQITRENYRKPIVSHFLEVTIVYYVCSSMRSVYYCK